MNQARAEFLLSEINAAISRSKMLTRKLEHIQSDLIMFMEEEANDSNTSPSPTGSD